MDKISHAREERLPLGGDLEREETLGFLPRILYTFQYVFDQILSCRAIRNHLSTAPSALRLLGDRALDILPGLTTLLALCVYPLIRYGSPKIFYAELFQILFITFWIGFLVVNMIKGLITRREIIANMDTDWMDQLLRSGHDPDSYAILMPLKGETNRHVLFQTFLSLQRQHYPKEKVVVFPIIEEEDRETVEKVMEILPSFKGKLDIRAFIYPAKGIPNPCKATSISMIGRWLSQKSDAGEFQRDRLKILIIDADTILHQQDLAFREYSHLKETKRDALFHRRGTILQSLTTYTSNYWKVPMLPRLHNTGFVLYQMGRMQNRTDYLILGPGTSIPFLIFEAVHYFEPNRHNEDMQFRYKVVMEGFRVAALKLPTWGQAPLTTRESWGQVSRWARGAADVKFIVKYKRVLPYTAWALRSYKPFLSLRALIANSTPPIMVLLPTELILISWVLPNFDRFGLGTFIYVYQTVVFTLSMLIGMIFVPHLLKPILYLPQPKRWKRMRRIFEWFRLVFTPINIHNYYLMAFAQLYTQTRMALGLSISHTEVTRK
jgi:cellulose synthase/poly-beta-1,6-N-acetylglucosamine synthase-like glycosyltransferase